MCTSYIVGAGPDGVLCDTHGELVEALGGTPVYHSLVDGAGMTDGDCLCGILPDATARKFGYAIAPKRSKYGDVVLTKVTS